jgi:hypothetical protein
MQSRHPHDALATATAGDSDLAIESELNLLRDVFRMLPAGVTSLFAALTSRRGCSGQARARPATNFPPYFASTGSGGTLSFGAPACMVISVIDVRS